MASRYRVFIWEDSVTVVSRAANEIKKDIGWTIY